MERHDAARQPAPQALRLRLGGAAAQRRGVSAGQCGTDRPPAVPRHAMRPASHHRYAALSPERRARCRRAPGPAHRMAEPADRALGQSLHRPDLSLRLDDGRLLPAAPGRRIQQSRRDTGHGRAGRNGGLRRPRRGGRAHRHDQARYDGDRRGEALSALFDVLPQLFAGRQGWRQSAHRPGHLAASGNTGRATNDHLHLEISISPTDSIGAIVDSLQRFPPYTTNPELWLEPLPNTGIIAGQVFDASGAAVPQARIYGIVKTDPKETPFSYAETYGEQGALPPALRRALRGERRAGRHVCDGHGHRREEDLPPGDGRSRAS